MGKKPNRVFQYLSVVVAIALLAGALFALVNLVRFAVAGMKRLDSTIVAALVTGAATILVATITVTVGRYFERKKDLEAVYRDKKMPIYGDFLEQLLAHFQPDAGTPPAPEELVKLLLGWHRNIILWGGPEVVNAYLAWKDGLETELLSAKTVFKMDAFILAIRKELGNVNRGIPKGLFLRMTLKRPELFFEMAAANPDVTLPEVAAQEAKIASEKAVSSSQQ